MHCNPSQQELLSGSQFEPTGVQLGPERLRFCWGETAAYAAAGSAMRRARTERRMIVRTVVGERCYFASFSAEIFYSPRVLRRRTEPGQREDRQNEGDRLTRSQVWDVEIADSDLDLEMTLVHT
jgi:hypothetical protein